MRKGRSFLKDCSANFAMIFSLALVALLAGVGVSVNFTQLNNVHSNLQQTLDAAILAAARETTVKSLSEQDAKEVTKKYLLANGNGNFISSAKIEFKDFRKDIATRTLIASIYIDTPIAFPILNGPRFKRVSATSQATYSATKIELALVLDITGSMENTPGGTDTTPKLESLQTAAIQALEALMVNQDPDDPRIRATLVPYSDAVNVGNLAAQTVFFETGPNTGNNPPSANAGHDFSGSPDNCATERKGPHQYSNAGPNSALVNRDYRLDTDYVPAPSCNPSELYPLTSDLTVLTAEIEDFVASGGTAGAVGIQWGWYMLSRSWAGFLPTTAAPAAKNDRKTAKFMIIMTDGLFNRAYAGNPPNPPTYKNILDFDAEGVTLSRTHSETLCTNIKKEGIAIFTITFDTTSEAAKSIMENCASPDANGVKYYHSAADGDALVGAFLDIARNINRLALVK